MLRNKDKLYFEWWWGKLGYIIIFWRDQARNPGKASRIMYTSCQVCIPISITPRQIAKGEKWERRTINLRYKQCSPLSPLCSTWPPVAMVTPIHAQWWPFILRSRYTEYRYQTIAEPAPRPSFYINLRQGSRYATIQGPHANTMLLVQQHPSIIPSYFYPYIVFIYITTALNG